MRRIEPYFPLSHGVLRVDDRRIVSGIIFVIRNGLHWRDAPREYGPPKTIYNRFVRWSWLGVFNKIFAALSPKGGKPDQLMIDATWCFSRLWWCRYHEPPLWLPAVRRTLMQKLSMNSLARLRSGQAREYALPTPRSA